MPATLNNTGILFNDSSQQNTAFTGTKAVVFTSNGTFTVPSGITFLKITAVGGGGGCSGATSSSLSTGGGGGGTIIKYHELQDQGDTLTIVVGTGGANGGPSGNGGDGSNTTVTSAVRGLLATGCGGGGGVYNGAGGSGGTAVGGTTGRLIIQGSDGHNAGSTGAAGGSHLGAALNPMGNYNAGANYGGGCPRRSTTSSFGGRGADGVVIIEY